MFGRVKFFGHRDSARQLLDLFDLPQYQQRLLWREARNRAHEAESLTGSYIIFWVKAMSMALLMVVFFPAILQTLLPRPVAFIFAVAMALGYVFFIYRTFNNTTEFRGMREAVIELLHQRGYRFCRSCYYDLRKLTSDIEYCPECGAYMSQRLTGSEDDPPILHHQQNPKSRIHEVVRGGNIPASEIEKAIIKGRAQYAETDKSINKSWRSTYIVVLILSLVWAAFLGKYVDSLSTTGVIVLAFLPLLSLIAFTAWLTVRLHDHSIRAARQELRRAGYEICINCGKSLDDLQAEVTDCPSCSKPRSSMS